MIRGSIPDKNERQPTSKMLKLTLGPTKPDFLFDRIFDRSNPIVLYQLIVYYSVYKHNNSIIKWQLSVL
jgi:hypothetical protein